MSHGVKEQCGEYYVDGIRIEKAAGSSPLFLELRCRIYRAEGMQNRTNADNIRSMRDEELVVFIEGCCQRYAPVSEEERYVRRMEILEWIMEEAGKD